VIQPSSLERNFMPTSTGESETASPSGPSADVKTVQGQLADVSKLQVRSAASGLPAESSTPPAPPLTLAVYVRPSGRSPVAVSVARRVSAS
jgi:hypothetical protein